MTRARAARCRRRCRRTSRRPPSTRMIGGPSQPGCVVPSIVTVPVIVGSALPTSICCGARGGMLKVMTSAPELAFAFSMALRRLQSFSGRLHAFAARVACLVDDEGRGHGSGHGDERRPERGENRHSQPHFRHSQPTPVLVRRRRALHTRRMNSTLASTRPGTLAPNASAPHGPFGPPSRVARSYSPANCGFFAPADAARRFLGVTDTVAAPATLEPYLPRLTVAWARDRPDERFRELDATLVSVDLSGFTALSERLAAKGKRGRRGADPRRSAASSKG